MTGLLIGGLAPFSTVDLPGQTAATLFCQGCPWRCRYCHNPHLQKPGAQAPLAWDAVLAWLEPRRGFLDAVVFSGGEPLLQPDLAEAMGVVKAMGFGVGLHTGGCRPGALDQVLPLLDWVGLDIKAPRHAYERITGVPDSGTAAWASLDLTVRSSVPHQIRTTYHPDLMTDSDLRVLDGELADAGAMNWVLQAFRPNGCADEALTAGYTWHEPSVGPLIQRNHFSSVHEAKGCKRCSASSALRGIWQNVPKRPEPGMTPGRQLFGVPARNGSAKTMGLH